MSQELRELEQLMQDDSVRRLINHLPPDIGKLQSLCRTHKHMLHLFRFRFRFSYSFRSSFSYRSSFRSSYSYSFRFIRAPILVRALVVINLLTNTLCTILDQPPTPAPVSYTHLTLPTLEQLMQDDSVRRLVNHLPSDIGKLHSLCHTYAPSFSFSFSF